jgi:hypothetical protein
MTTGKGRVVAITRIAGGGVGLRVSGSAMAAGGSSELLSLPGA